MKFMILISVLFMSTANAENFSAIHDCWKEDARSPSDGKFIVTLSRGHFRQFPGGLVHFVNERLKSSPFIKVLAEPFRDRISEADMSIPFEVILEPSVRQKNKQLAIRMMEELSGIFFKDITFLCVNPSR